MKKNLLFFFCQGMIKRTIRYICSNLKNKRNEKNDFEIYPCRTFGSCILAKLL